MTIEELHEKLAVRVWVHTGVTRLQDRLTCAELAAILGACCRTEPVLDSAALESDAKLALKAGLIAPKEREIEVYERALDDSTRCWQDECGY